MSRNKHTVDVDLTTAANLIGVDRKAMIQALRDERHILQNDKHDNIASRTMLKLGYFINDLRHLNDKAYLRVYELPLVTTWGMQFLREFCEEKKIPKKSAETAQKKPAKRTAKTIAAANACFEQAGIERRASI